MSMPTDDDAKAIHDCTSLFRLSSNEPKSLL